RPRARSLGSRKALGLLSVTAELRNLWFPSRGLSGPSACFSHISVMWKLSLTLIKSAPPAPRRSSGTAWDARRCLHARFSPRPVPGHGPGGDGDPGGRDRHDGIEPRPAAASAAPGAGHDHEPGHRRNRNAELLFARVRSADAE